MGFDCPLEIKTTFIYRAPFANGLTEHEYDHVFTGIYDGPITNNPVEVADYKWIKVAALRTDMKKIRKNIRHGFILLWGN